MDPRHYNRMLIRLYRLPLLFGLAALTLLAVGMSLLSTLRALPAPDTLFLLLFATVAGLCFAALGTALSLSLVLLAWRLGRLIDCANCRGLLVRRRDALGAHQHCLACQTRFCLLDQRPAWMARLEPVLAPLPLTVGPESLAPPPAELDRLS